MTVADEESCGHRLLIDMNKLLIPKQNVLQIRQNKLKICTLPNFVSENIWDITYYILLYHKKYFLKV